MMLCELRSCYLALRKKEKFKNGLRFICVCHYRISQEYLHRFIYIYKLRLFCEPIFRQPMSHVSPEVHKTHNEYGLGANRIKIIPKHSKFPRLQQPRNFKKQNPRMDRQSRLTGPLPSVLDQIYREDHQSPHKVFAYTKAASQQVKGQENASGIQQPAQRNHYTTSVSSNQPQKRQDDITIHDKMCKLDDLKISMLKRSSSETHNLVGVSLKSIQEVPNWNQFSQDNKDVLDMLNRLDSNREIVGKDQVQTSVTGTVIASGDLRRQAEEMQISGPADSENSMRDFQEQIKAHKAFIKQEVQRWQQQPILDLQKQQSPANIGNLPANHSTNSQWSEGRQAKARYLKKTQNSKLDKFGAKSKSKRAINKQISSSSDKKYGLVSKLDNLQHRDSQMKPPHIWYNSLMSNRNPPTQQNSKDKDPRQTDKQQGRTGIAEAKSKRTKLYSLTKPTQYYSNFHGKQQESRVIKKAFSVYKSNKANTQATFDQVPSRGTHALRENNLLRQKRTIQSRQVAQRPSTKRGLIGSKLVSPPQVNRSNPNFFDNIHEFLSNVRPSKKSTYNPIQELKKVKSVPLIKPLAIEQAATKIKAAVTKRKLQQNETKSQIDAADTTAKKMGASTTPIGEIYQRRLTERKKRLQRQQQDIKDEPVSTLHQALAKVSQGLTRNQRYLQQYVRNQQELISMELYANLVRSKSTKVQLRVQN